MAVISGWFFCFKFKKLLFHLTIWKGVVMSRYARTSILCCMNLLVFAVIIYLSSCIDGHIVAKFTKHGMDKVAHLIEYAILTFLVIRVVRSSFPRLGALGASLFVALIVLVCAALDERHQSLVPYRNCSMSDFTADFFGMSVVLMAFVYRDEENKNFSKSEYLTKDQAYRFSAESRAGGLRGDQAVL
jgi:VanZ family protein